MRARVVILMPSIDRNAFGVRELLVRQDYYCSKLQEVQGEAFEKPLIIISGSTVPNFRFQYVDISVAARERVSLLSFVWLTRKILRHESVKVKSYVAGTPFQPFLSALLLQIFHSPAPIHIAIHGEVSALTRSGISGRLKFLFLKFFIHKASSVRFVSNGQLIDARSVLPLDESKTYITPVPILNYDKSSRERNLKTIAFVGRLQSERGVEDWIEIAKEFDEKDLVVIGDGPLLPLMKTRLPNAKFLGSLTNSEVQETWSKIGVLLSTASFESYGLAMREALLNNVPVVSRRNVGSSELNANYPNLVKLFDNKEEAIQKLVEALTCDYSSEEFARFNSKFFVNQEESLKLLGRAWCNEI